MREEESGLLIGVLLHLREMLALYSEDRYPTAGQEVIDNVNDNVQGSFYMCIFH